MPDRFTIKRNSLSSKWGVWETRSGSDSTVERLVVELRSNEDAEAYCSRIEAGESHDLVVASLAAQKPKQEGGGLFGRFRRRKAASDDPGVNGSVSNPVIRIEANGTDVGAEDKVAAKPAAPTVSESPSRFQVIERPKPEPVVPEGPKVVEPEAAVAAQPEAVKEPEVEAAEEPRISMQAAETASEPKSVDKAVPEPEDAEDSTWESLVEAEPVPMPASEIPLDHVLEPSAKDQQERPDTAKSEASGEDGAQAEAAAKQSSLADRVKGVFRSKKSAEPTESKKPAQSPGIDAVAPKSTPTASSASTSLPASQPASSRPEPTTLKQKSPEPLPNRRPDIPAERQPAAPVADVSGGKDAAASDAAKKPEPFRSAGSNAPQTTQPAQTAPRPQSGPPSRATAFTSPAQAPKPATREPAAQAAMPSATAPAGNSARTTGKPQGRSSLTVEIGISKALREAAVGDPEVSDRKYNAVASKEFAEVRQALASGDSQEALHKELIHLAAVCLAWADAIEKRKDGNSSRKAA